MERWQFAVLLGAATLVFVCYVTFGMNRFLAFLISGHLFILSLCLQNYLDHGKFRLFVRPRSPKNNG